MKVEDNVIVDLHESGEILRGHYLSFKCPYVILSVINKGIEDITNKIDQGKNNQTTELGSTQ